MTTKYVYLQSPEGFVFETCVPEYHKDCTKVSQAKGKDAMKQQYIDTLREIIKPGDTIYTVLNHASRSGMQREISLCVICNNEPRYISGYVATALGHKQGKQDGILVGGCGQDMGFALVYALSYTLYPNGFGCIGVGCPSNDHNNGDRNYTPDASPEIYTHWHTSGGYALRHKWM